MPEAASLRLAPCVVLISSMTTPFWFFMIEVPAPPPTVAPAPAAVKVPLKAEMVFRLDTLRLFSRGLGNSDFADRKPLHLDPELLTLVGQRPVAPTEPMPTPTEPSVSCSVP